MIRPCTVQLRRTEWLTSVVQVRRSGSAGSVRGRGRGETNANRPEGRRV
jgi:hypothetical protein